MTANTQAAKNAAAAAASYSNANKAVRTEYMAYKTDAAEKQATAIAAELVVKKAAAQAIADKAAAASTDFRAKQLSKTLLPFCLADPDTCKTTA